MTDQTESRKMILKNSTKSGGLLAGIKNHGQAFALRIFARPQMER
jgi:hypothetical protein